MGLNRRNPSRDTNEAEIVRTLRQYGGTVSQISGKDLPDLVVGRLGRNYLLEGKSGSKKLTKAQEKWAITWMGQSATVRTPAEALAAVGIGTRRSA